MVNVTEIGDVQAMQVWPGLPTLWLSSHELLYYRGSAYTPWDLWKRDVRTGKDSHLKELSLQLRKKKAHPGFQQISADGRFVLSRTPAGIAVCTVGGQSFHVHPIGDKPWNDGLTMGNPYAWIKDSRHWVELVQGDHVGQIAKLRIHPVQGKGSREVTLVPQLSLPVHFFGGRNYEIAQATDSRLRILAPHMKTIHGPFYNATQSMNVMTAAEVVEIDLSGTQATPRAIPLPLPANKNVVAAHLAPDGEQITWLVWNERASGSAQSIRISDIAGRGWRQIVDVERSAENIFHGFQDIHWVPGGERISFYYFWRLYTADVKGS